MAVRQYMETASQHIGSWVVIGGCRIIVGKRLRRMHPSLITRQGTALLELANAIVIGQRCPAYVSQQLLFSVERGHEFSLDATLRAVKVMHKAPFTFPRATMPAVPIYRSRIVTSTDESSMPRNACVAPPAR